MIPKTIHYCWFGGNPLPALAQKCIHSWKKYLPDYTIIEWNESNFDVSCVPYVREAYEAKKFAFVSDYARFWILYNHGGVYFDTDVEIIKPIDHIIEKGAFMGIENQIGSFIQVSPGLGIGCEAYHPFYKEMLDAYANIHFVINGSYNYKTIGQYNTELLRNKGLQNINNIQTVDNITIYPFDYFSPIDTTTKRIHITANTCAIHHYAGSWLDGKESKFKVKLRKVLPEWFLIMYSKFKR